MTKSFKEIVRLLSDDRAQAMTEYVLLMVFVSVWCFYLYDPHNGLYKAMRDTYDRTTLLLMFPGP